MTYTNDHTYTVSAADQKNDIRWTGRINEKTIELTRRMMSKAQAGNTDFKISIDKVDGHNVTCSMPFSTHMKNSSGTLMGGYTFLLADFCGGAADIMPGLEDSMHTTIDGHMQYLAPGVGKKIIAHAHCEHYGRKLAYYTIEIYSDEGRHIAQASLTYLHLI